MEREQGGDKNALPVGTGQPQEKQEEHDRVDCMEQDVYEVVRPWIESEQLDIQHMRQPCQRMPVGRVGRGERPDEAFSGQACSYVGIFEDVLPVIEVHELVTAYLPVNCEGNDDQEQARQCCIPHGQ